jgi:hypothetical protein
MIPSYDSYQHPSLFIEKHSTIGVVRHCVLCEKDLATDADRDAHYDGKAHKQHVSALYGMQQSQVAMHCATLQERMDIEMPDRTTHIPIQLKMYWILLNCHPMTVNRVWCPEILTAQATAMIDEYVLKQSMWLLELAVWKAMCMLSSSGATTLDYYTVQAWLHHGWKVNKSAMRNSNEIGIILRAVLPFMG